MKRVEEFPRRCRTRQKTRVFHYVWAQGSRDTRDARLAPRGKSPGFPSRAFLGHSPFPSRAFLAAAHSRRRLALSALCSAVRGAVFPLPYLTRRAGASK